MRKTIGIILITISALTLVYFVSPKPHLPPLFATQNSPAKSSLNTTPLDTPAPTASLPASPTPTPTLSPEEREAKYGPCAYIPTLMYHHIQTEDLAKAGGYSGLNVTPDNFSKHLTYLQDHGYTPIKLEQLISFFDQGVTLPKKPVLLTFDDAYADFTQNAAPLLSQFNFPSTLFVPTGLLENPGYTTWKDLTSLNASLFLFGNHTWSHHSAAGDLKTETFEITTADAQLKDHHFNTPLVFAYPYGPSSKNDETVLSSLGYKLAFTTTHGTYLCKGQRYDLPRIRVGNSNLSNYGL